MLASMRRKGSASRRLTGATISTPPGTGSSSGQRDEKPIWASTTSRAVRDKDRLCIGLLHDLAVRQCLLQRGDAAGADQRPAEREALQFRQARQPLDAPVADRGVVDAQ